MQDSPHNFETLFNLIRLKSKPNAVGLFASKDVTGNRKFTKFMKRIFYLLTCFLVIPFGAFSQSQQITLEEAIQIALENNYQLQQAENNLGLAETDVFSAKADFLPSVSGSFSGSRQSGLTFIQEDLAFEDRTTFGLNGSVSTDVTIFDGFRNIANLRSAEASRLSQEEELERLHETIIFNTASRYLEVVLNQELLKIAESALEASRSQVEQIEAQVEVGSIPTVDLYNQEAQVANDELAVIQAENALEFSIAQLLRIMQDDSIKEVELSMPSTEELSLVPRKLNLQEMIEVALQNRSDFMAQESTIESNENNLRIARSSLMPSLSANASLGSRFSDQQLDPLQTNQVMPFYDQFFDINVTRSIGFSLQIPIFSGWNNRANLQSAQIQLKNSQLELDNIRFQISEEIRQAYNDYVSISKELESTEKALIAAERAYETEQQRYEVGSTTLIELNQANANYVQAQSNRVQAVYNFVFQEQLLDYYVGRLSEDVEF